MIINNNFTFYFLLIIEAIEDIDLDIVTGYSMPNRKPSFF